MKNISTMAKMPIFIDNGFRPVKSAINRKSCYLVLMIFVFLTAIVLLIILGLTVGMTFGQETGDSMPRSKLGQLLEIQQEQLMIIFISHIG